jgi:hypothetical protein
MGLEFTWFTILASYPLRHGYEGGAPTANCSGAVIEFQGKRLLLTVAHAVKPDEAWALEIQYEASRGTKLWKLGQMQYFLQVEPSVIKDVDFAFTEIPTDLRAKYQRFSEQGIVIGADERVILDTDLTAAPHQGLKYGFAGGTQHTGEPALPGFPHEIAGSELRYETGLTYRDTVDGLDRYDLGHPHPGHKYYKGCSGAPLLSENGDLVGLVVCGSEEDATIFALPLRQYASAIAAALKTSETAD